MHMDNSIIVALKNIVVDFDGEPILTGLSLDIHDKEFVTLLGPSGCGKTTTLRVIGGFVEPRSGNVFFAGRDITRLPPYKRQVNTVFQKYALFPHLNVFENVAFGLRLQKLDEKEIRSRCLEMLELVGLKGYERRNTAALSGGQQQRVAIARALVNHPKVLLLDEPLGALDLKLRKDMQIELKRIQQSLDITFIYVTHDQEEALTMSDTVVVMNRGDIQQIGSPQDIYNEPNNAFVADFIGESNILDGVMLRQPGDRAGGGAPGGYPGGARHSGPADGPGGKRHLQGRALRDARAAGRLRVDHPLHTGVAGGRAHRHEHRAGRDPHHAPHAGVTADEKDKMDRFALSGMDGGVHRRAAGHRGVFRIHR